MNNYIKLETTGQFIKLPPYFIEELAAKTTAGISFKFAEYLQNVRFNQLFINRTDETLNSIKAYRYTGIGYLVKAGVGIKGSLNYLAGVYRGKTDKFSYSKKRDLLQGGWKAWGGDEKLLNYYDKLLDKMAKDAGF